MNSIFVHLLIIIGTLGVMILVEQKWRINMTLGCLLGGFFLGPLGFNILPKTFTVTSFFHVCLMMFLGIVGLEIPFHRFKVFLKPMITQGIPQIVLTSIALFPLMALLAPSLSYGWCWVLSLAFSFSSTALVLHLLQEREELSTTLGRRALSLLFTQDIAAILLLTVIGFISLQEENNISGWNLLPFVIIIGKIFCCGMLTWVVNFFIKKYYTLFSSQESLFLFGFLIILSGGYLGQMSNLSAELGAFLGGMILASSPLRHGVVHTLDPLRPLCVGVFFLSIGLELTRWPSGENCLIILISTALFMILKILTIWFLTRKKNPAFSLLLGCLMASGSEFVFMVLALCKNQIDPGTMNTFLFMAFLSFLLTPLLYNKIRLFLNNLGEDMEEATEICPCIVIAGFGSLGRAVSRLLHHHHIPFLVIDHHEEKIKHIQESGYEGVLGDVRDLDFLASIGLDQGRIFLITFGHLEFMPQWIRFLKLRFPHLNLCVQVKTYEEAALLSTLDLHIILKDEGEEKGESMACVAFHALGFSWEKAKTMTHQGLYYNMSS